MASFGSTSESCGGAFDTAGGMFGVIDDDAKCTGGGTNRLGMEIAGDV
jgi:hypothetical protein